FDPINLFWGIAHTLDGIELFVEFFYFGYNSLFIHLQVIFVGAWILDPLFVKDGIHTVCGIFLTGVLHVKLHLKSFDVNIMVVVKDALFGIEELFHHSWI